MHLLLNRSRTIALLCFLVTGCSPLLSLAQSPQANEQDRPNRRVRPAFQPIQEDPALARVLLLGDSISIGYTVDVQQQLDGEANVIRPAANCGPTTRGLESLEQWLGDGKWDVVHFNFGLHDLKYIDDRGQLVAVDAPGAHQQVPLPQYTENLQKLVKRLQQTGATLIWCNTTPVPEGAKGRVPGDAVKYNAAAAEVMKKAGIPTDDLYSAAKAKLSEIQRPANVHFSEDGSAYLAEQVTASLRKALAAKK